MVARRNARLRATATRIQPETNPLRKACFPRVRASRLSPTFKEKNPHGTRKTRHQAPCTAQEVPQEDQRLFPHEEQALPIGAGSGESRGPLCLPRPPREEAAVSSAVDSAHRRGRAAKWPDLRSVDSRAEGRGRRAGPQSAGGHRGEGRRGVYAACGKGQGCRPAANQKSLASTLVAPASCRCIVPWGHEPWCLSN